MSNLLPLQNVQRINIRRMPEALATIQTQGFSQELQLCNQSPVALGSKSSNKSHDSARDVEMCTLCAEAGVKERIHGHLLHRLAYKMHVHRPLIQAPACIRTTSHCTACTRPLDKETPRIPPCMPFSSTPKKDN